MLGLNNSVPYLNGSYLSDDTYKSSVYLEFDGVNEYGELSGSDKETFMHAVGTTGGSISFWVRSSDIYSGTNNIVEYIMGGFFFSSPNVSSFYIGTKNDSGTNRIVIVRSDLNIATGASTVWSDYKTTGADHLSDNTWHHIVVTLKPFSSTWRTLLYVDGTAASLTAGTYSVNASNSVSPASNSMPQTIAKYNTIYDAWDLNEIATWSTELSSSEVSYIYNQGLIGFNLAVDAGDYTSSGDLYTWHTMGEKVTLGEAVEPDSSGSDMHMTLYNAPSRLEH